MAAAGLIGQEAPATYLERVCGGRSSCWRSDRWAHAPDFRSTVEEVLLLARRLHRAATPVTQTERDVP